MPKTLQGGKEFDAMAVAIGKYIKAIGGTAVVVGGVKVGQEWGSAKYNYFIQIGITGKMPEKKNEDAH